MRVDIKPGEPMQLPYARGKIILQHACARVTGGDGSTLLEADIPIKRDMGKHIMIEGLAMAGNPIDRIGMRVLPVSDTEAGVVFHIACYEKNVAQHKASMLMGIHRQEGVTHPDSVSMIDRFVSDNALSEAHKALILAAADIAAGKGYIQTPYGAALTAMGAQMDVTLPEPRVASEEQENARGKRGGLLLRPFQPRKERADSSVNR